jgi:hypothetical protein
VTIVNETSHYNKKNSEFATDKFLEESAIIKINERKPVYEELKKF